MCSSDLSVSRPLSLSHPPTHTRIHTHTSCDHTPTHPHTHTHTGGHSTRCARLLCKSEKNEISGSHLPCASARIGRKWRRTGEREVFVGGGGGGGGERRVDRMECVQRRNRKRKKDRSLTSSYSSTSDKHVHTRHTHTHGHTHTHTHDIHTHGHIKAWLQRQWRWEVLKISKPKTKFLRFQIPTHMCFVKSLMI